MVNFLDKKKLVLFRTVRKFYIFRQHNGPDIALLLLTRPVTVCDPKRRNSSERFEILRLPLGNPLRSGWSDRDVENAKCVMYGYGRNEKHLKLDYRLRSMPIKLKVRSPELISDLSKHQKICEVIHLPFYFFSGDSGGPVVCIRNGIRYLIGISTSVTSKLSSKRPQLCGLKTVHGQGDSGGPVVCMRNGIRYLIGISTSVTSKLSSKRPQLCGLKTVHGQVKFKEFIVCNVF
uniref:Peptidase S1 domain-containing protein n=1 Tax=Ascaris lumbricoides TaxID=6252 RepID=A0A0M3ISY8_ASCLU